LARTTVLPRLVWPTGNVLFRVTEKVRSTGEPTLMSTPVQLIVRVPAS